MKPKCQECERATVRYSGETCNGCLAGAYEAARIRTQSRSADIAPEAAAPAPAPPEPPAATDLCRKHGCDQSRAAKSRRPLCARHCAAWATYHRNNPGVEMDDWLAAPHNRGKGHGSAEQPAPSSAAPTANFDDELARRMVEAWATLSLGARLEVCGIAVQRGFEESLP